MSDPPIVNHSRGPGQSYARHKWWKIPLGCLLLIVLGAIFFAGIFSIAQYSFKSSDAYKEALARAEADPITIARLGQPIHPGWFVSGEIEVSGSTGKARLAIPLKGPKNSGTLHVDAVKTSGQWRFRTLQLEVAGSDDRLDLSQPSSDDQPLRD
jgi:hypothetical protein